MNPQPQGLYSARLNSLLTRLLRADENTSVLAVFSGKVLRQPAASPAPNPCLLNAWELLHLRVPVGERAGFFAFLKGKITLKQHSVAEAEGVFLPNSHFLPAFHGNPLLKLEISKSRRSSQGVISVFLRVMGRRKRCGTSCSCLTWFHLFRTKSERRVAFCRRLHLFSCLSPFPPFRLPGGFCLVCWLKAEALITGSLRAVLSWGPRVAFP